MADHNNNLQSLVTDRLNIRHGNKWLNKDAHYYYYPAVTLTVTVHKNIKD